MSFELQGEMREQEETEEDNEKLDLYTQNLQREICNGPVTLKWKQDDNLTVTRKINK